MKHEMLNVSMLMFPRVLHLHRGVCPTALQRPCPADQREFLTGCTQLPKFLLQHEWGQHWYPARVGLGPGWNADATLGAPWQ